jgi:lycopene beta-cyclase
LPTDLDLVVLGGGCAGLSLALRLAEEPGRCRRARVLESRADYTNDRSWCFWRLGPHRYDSLVRRSWPRLAVRSSARTVPIDCAGTPYQMLEAGTFYDHARSVVSSGDAMRLDLGVSVAGPPRPVPGGWRIETSAGGLTAAQVIDTRPSRPPRHGDSVLWQSFLGQELVCDRPVFDAGRVELMDFAPDAPHAVAFTYVLPLTSDHALVETTLFDPEPHGPADLARRQRQAVHRLCGGAQARVVRTESGVLPMGLARREAALGPGHVRVGLTSGAARPATGYAFQRIQRWADGCAEALRRGQPASGHAPDPLLTRLMDRLFLDVLRTHPERGPELFTSLFERAATPRVVRFLSDRARLMDRIAVASSLPAGLFLRQLLRPTPRGVVQAQPL